MMSRPIVRALILLLGIFLASFALTFIVIFVGTLMAKRLAPPLACVAPPGTAPPPRAEPPSKVFIYSFNVPGILQEAGNESESTSPYWYLNSGGRLLIDRGIGATIQGSVSWGDRWHDAYARTNPLDTDGGAHPQNIFRLVTKRTWSDVSEEVWFRITADNFSSSPNRNQSNGLLLMSRYVDHDNLYYAGIRVDGTAVIKKKYAGVYYTMVQVPFFAGAYSEAAQANLLPHGAWLGLRAITETGASGAVAVRFYYRPAGAARWTLAAFATDRGQFGGTPPITERGAAGVRTDFMDVEFKDIRIEEL